jgi:hypothetical protein
VVRDIFVGFVKAMTVSVGNGRRHRHPSPLTAVVACQAIRRRCPFCPPNRCMHLRTSAHRRPEGGSSTHLLAPAGNLSTRLSAAPRNLVEVFHPECAFGAQPTWASALPAPQRYGAVTRVACRATVEWSPDRPPQQPQLGLQPLRAYQNHHRENPPAPRESVQHGLVRSFPVLASTLNRPLATEFLCLSANQENLPGHRLAVSRSSTRYSSRFPTALPPLLYFGFGCLIVRAPRTQHIGPGLGLVETPLPSIDVADALLDERRELTGLPRLTRCLGSH